MPNGPEQEQQAEGPFDGIAKIIEEGLRFTPPSPDNRVLFELSDDELAYLRGDQPEPPTPRE